MQRRVGGVAAAVVLAALGTALLVSYVQSAKAGAVAGEKLVPILVVKEPIARGEAPVLGKSIVRREVPAKVRAEGSVTSVAALKNLVADVDLVPGEQVVRSRFVTKEASRKSVVVPPDKLEVTVSLEPQRALGGAVRPGDTVGVVLSQKPFSEQGSDGNHSAFVSRMVLHKVLVTRVAWGQAPVAKADDEKEKDGDAKGAAKDAKEPTIAPTGALLVTFALDAHSVERVVFTAEYGSIWLAAEKSTASEAGSKATTYREIFE